MKKYVFCQFDTRFLYRGEVGSIADDFYSRHWQAKEQDGYYKPDAFWEIPTWITEVDGVLAKHGYKSELKVISGFEYFYLGEYTPTTFLFSVLDINKEYVKQVIKANTSCDFIVGGYIDNPHDFFRDCPNVTWRKSVEDFCNTIGVDIPYSYEVSYRLFAGVKCIPRLTMSTGCNHNCKFCCVEKCVKHLKADDVRKQLDAMTVLDYQLIYLNDKTFGQAQNFKDLAVIWDVVRHCNPDFSGFIIQTTAQKCSSPAFCEFISGCGVLIVEMGIETFNNDLLAEYRKPHNEKMILKSMQNLQAVHINVIANVLIGLVGETKKSYSRTLTFLELYRPQLYSLNIFNLAIYAGTDLAAGLGAADDTDEMKSEKSYHTPDDLEAINYFTEGVFDIGNFILGEKNYA